jgi:signal transduction histidine kinase
METQHTIDELVAENTELNNRLREAEGIIKEIREGGVDALVVKTDGKTNLYSLETADYTYRLLIENIGEGALSVSEKGLVLYCNDYFANMVNIPANEIVGTYFNSYVHSAGDFKKLQDGIASGLSKGEITLNISGRKIPVYISLTSLQPKLAGSGIIVTNLTEQKKQSEALILNQRKLELKVNELRHTNQCLEEFVHVVSHDIKEPIRKIVAYGSQLKILIAASSSQGKEAYYQQVINASAMRLNALVDDLVKYSLATVKTEPLMVDARAVVSDVLEDLELVISENQAKINIGSLPKIKASEVQLRQLFSNLILNAIKFRKKEVAPEISIHAEIVDCVDPNFPNKQFHEVRVSDNGIGIAKEYLGKVFTIFQRLHMPGEYAGNGIGLAICKKIMENHLGRISAESQIDQGSTFSLFFPVVYNY